MKVLAIVLLCAVAAVQGRSARLQKDEAIEPVRGEVGYLVHLRIAIGTSGLLQTGLGALISNNWVLTAASPVEDSRFIWQRFGSEYVPRPNLVIESNAVTRNPDYNPLTGANNIAVINTNRNIEFTNIIFAVGGLSGIINSNVVLYGYGQDESGRPGVRLQSFELEVDEDEDGAVTGVSAQGPLARYDVGAPIVSDDGRQVALLSGVDSQGVAQLLRVEDYVSWVEQVTNLNLGETKA